MKDPFVKKLAFAAVIVSALILIAVPFYLKRQKDSITYTRNLMGTIVQITLMRGERARFDAASDAAFDEIKRLEALFSSYMPESDVSRISREAGLRPVKVSPEVTEVAGKAIGVADISGGAFDPTVGALSKVWGPSGEKGYVPSKEEVGRLLPLVGYKEMEIDKASSTIFLRKKGMALNLGGIAKGYIIDKAAQVLKANGVERGIIHAGGDMVVFQEDEERQFIIGIQHPREKKLLGEAHLYNGAVATSGDYERFFIKDGVRYHHILDPKTGFPATRSIAVTIIAKDPAIADGLSTAVFVLGPKEGMGLIGKIDGAEGAITGADGKVTVSKGFEGWLADSSKTKY
ncbi:MAG: FAD:protein FMN transferase [Deltaproteobacteria bacterium]|nr:FAD:protein FMN transferase [Deltaproteobacteria bacterium]